MRGSFNFPVANNFTLEQLTEQIKFIYEQSQFNMSFGLILQHIETEEYRYFIPYYNESVFSRSVFINRNDLNRLRDRLARLDLPNYLSKQNGVTDA